MWCCCGIPLDFYCAMQTWRRQAVDTIKIDKGLFLTRDLIIGRGDNSLTSMIIQFEENQDRNLKITEQMKTSE
ncbi:hypothetical protein STEG23_005673 [Scotinomys teguina]